MYIICWVGAIAAFFWAMLFAELWWSDVVRFFDADNVSPARWQNPLIFADLILLIVLGLYLCLVTVVKVYAHRGFTTRRWRIVVRKVAAVVTCILAFPWCFMLVCCCIFSFILGIVTVFIGIGIPFLFLAAVSACIPPAIFMIAKMACEERPYSVYFPDIVPTVVSSSTVSPPSSSDEIVSSDAPDAPHSDSTDIPKEE